MPLVAYHPDYGRGHINTDPARGFDLFNPWPYLADAKIKANLAALVAMFPAFGLYSDPATFDSYVRTEIAKPQGVTLRDARREWFTESLSDQYLSDNERMKAAAALWEMAGVPVLLTESTGYSQGDWAALLIVAHPEAVKAFGFKTMAAYRKACPNDLTAAADLWGAYTWGGVVGYVVKDPKGRNVDSCWGFYPEGGQHYFPLETSHAYAIGEAEAAAEWDAKKVAAKKAERMAESIMAARPDLAPVWVTA